jgi:UDP-glucose 4-epimerase
VRTLITGGAGFIGGHLVEHLLGLGREVVVLDDLSTGRAENLAAVREDPRLRFVLGSVCDPGQVARCAEGVDEIYHLAAAVGVFTILDRPLAGLHTNLDGTRAVLEAARERGVPVLVASTSEVYGKNTERLAEDSDRILGSPLKSRWSYAEAKALDETLAYLYGVEYGLGTVIARLFNTVGPRQTGRYGMVVPRFVAQALAGEPLTVYGDGRQVRCFCHVADVVPALVGLLGDPTAHGDVYNVGNSEPTTILELARRVLEAAGSDSEIRLVPYAEAYGAGFEDMQRRVPDCTKLRERTGFQPTRGLADIVESVVAEQRAAAAAGLPA